MNTLWVRLVIQRPLVAILLFIFSGTFIFILFQSRQGYVKQNENVYYAFDPDGGSQEPVRIERADLEARVSDLQRIRVSLREELRHLQRERTKILKERASLQSRNERILSQISRSKAQLKQLELDLSADKKQHLSQTCSSDIVIPIVFNPLKSVDIQSFGYGREQSFLGTSTREHQRQQHVSTDYQFDLRLCPLTRRFSFDFSTNRERSLSKLEGNTGLAVMIMELLMAHHYHSAGTEQAACMTVILMYDSKLNDDDLSNSTNNLIVNLSDEPIDVRKYSDIMTRAAFASSSFARGSFRRGVDVVIPRTLQQSEQLESILGSSPLLSPLRRRYFASYFGSNKMSNESGPPSLTDQILQTVHRSSVDDALLFIYNCGRDENRECFDERERMIELSTFHIIIPDGQYDMDTETNDLIYLALSRGSIPVIMGSERVRLFFDEAIDWRLSSILLPSDRLAEVHFILRSLGPSDIYSLKYHGRRIFEQYLATSKQIIDSLVSLFSLNRLNYPPEPIKPVITSAHIPSHELHIDVNCTSSTCLEIKSELMNNFMTMETLGPRERPFKSPTFNRNYSLSLNRLYDLWNEPLFSPKILFPSHPRDPLSPSEYKFISSDTSYRPINDGLGGSGMEFSQALGGDYPNEQFTIVLLTHERVPLLMQTLERLKGLAYLNKILIVWNGINQRPQEDLVWPDVGVPIVLVKVAENSLNNRFLPYDAIETDAIFSMDDDSPLRQDEIVFAFRVWRESRDRIVGFPGRYHAWDSYQNSWQYNSNHSCELSMVLTGGAFFHKYYSFVYSQLMPSSIRSIVDKFMNCEDIAMNFLVAHLTRKPPVKVTSRWTFHCANCKTSLSKDESHFMERHECLNIFTSIYGYMPLLSTQHRSDSILFKTRLPKDKQKCFRFV